MTDDEASRICESCKRNDCVSRFSKKTSAKSPPKRKARESTRASTEGSRAVSTAALFANTAAHHPTIRRNGRSNKSRNDRRNKRADNRTGRGAERCYAGASRSREGPEGRERRSAERPKRRKRAGSVPGIASLRTPPTTKTPPRNLGHCRQQPQPPNHDASKTNSIHDVPVSDTPRAVEFYRDKLGLTPSALQSDFWTEFDVDGSTFGVGNFEQVGKPGSAQSLALEVSDMTEFRSMLSQRGVESTEPHDLKACWISVVQDPDGNQIWLHQSKSG